MDQNPDFSQSDHQWMEHALSLARKAQDEGEVPVLRIFASSTPYWIVMLIAMVAIVVFPQIATYLPGLAF